MEHHEACGTELCAVGPDAVGLYHTDVVEVDLPGLVGDILAACVGEADVSREATPRGEAVHYRVLDVQMLGQVVHHGLVTTTHTCRVSRHSKLCTTYARIITHKSEMLQFERLREQPVFSVQGAGYIIFQTTCEILTPPQAC